MKRLHADIVLWPVYTDFNCEEWNKTIKYEYAEQVARIGHGVCLVNSVCLDREGSEIIFRYIGPGEIADMYLPMGFEHYKIEGRSLGSAMVLEILLH